MIQNTLFEKQENESFWLDEVLKKLEIEESSGWPDEFGEKISTLLNKKEINTLSLFSGGGGLDIAFSDIGFNIKECVEIDSRFVETLKENSNKNGKIAGAKISCIDIREYNPEFKNIDFIIGGPPCQTFSAAGARVAGVKALNDKRGTLFEEYVRIVDLLKPKGFLFENVYRIVGAQNGEPWRLIQKAFKDIGYKIHWRILDASDYGVPQHRERLIIVGTKEGEYKFPYPTHGNDSKSNKNLYTSGEALSNLSEKIEEKPFTGRHGHLLKDIPPGLNYSFYTEKMGHPNPIFGWRSKFSDYLYKADPERPVRTIKAQGGQYTGPLSWKNRAFTINEFKRLQTFPDNYNIKGNRQVQIMQIGNSVPPQLGRILALSVLEQVFNIDLPFNIDYMQKEFELGFRKRKSTLTKHYAKKAKDAITKQLENGTIEITNSIFTSGEKKLHISSDFLLSDVKLKSSVEYQTLYNLNDEFWNIIIQEPLSKNEEQYSIEIHLSDVQQEILKTKRITLISKSSNKKSLLTLWKILERKVKKYAHKDDLIQLFGYYKSQKGMLFSFKILNPKINDIEFWNFVSEITKGTAIGEEMNITKISSLFQIDDITFKKYAKELKSIGFEIRNNNTNSQLKENHFLIPYRFPTLNERSLQRLTNL